MCPVLKENYSLLKQYKSSIVYPLFEDNDSAVMSGIYSYERINETGAEILELCNGGLSIEEIARSLAEKHGCTIDESLPLVRKFVEAAERKGYLFITNNKGGRHINVSGNFEVIFPFNAQIEITKRCPLKCRHCFNYSGVARSKEMSTSDLFVVIDKLAAMGIKKVMLTGGEPTLREDFIEIATYAAKRFMAISIATNGYYITPKMVAALSKAKNVVVQVSLDGTESNHNFIRGVDDSFSRAVNAIQSQMLNIIENSDQNRIVGGCIDGEGFPRNPTFVFKNGAYQNLISKFSTNENGNCSGSAYRFDYATLPQTKATKIYIEPGPLSEEELLPSYDLIGKIDSFQGMYESFDRNTFDFTALLHIKILKYGSIAGFCTKQVHLNLIDILSRISTLSNNMNYSGDGSFFIPSMICEIEL